MAVGVIPPEDATIHRKKMEVNWDRLDPRLQCVDGLDDIMRFDLQHFCRRMQPPEEPHYRSAHQSSMSHFMSCHVMSCHVMSCRVVSCRVVSCRVVSCRVVSCHVMSCHVMSSRKNIACKSALACTFVLELPACLYLAYTSSVCSTPHVWSCTCAIMPRNSFKFGFNQRQASRQHVNAIQAVL